MPLERAALRGRAFLAGLSYLLRAREVYAENEELRRNLNAIRSRTVLADALEQENIALRRQLELSERQYGLIHAEVLSAGGIDGWSQRIRISKGSRQGIVPHSPVICPEGLVGIVAETTPNTAEVLLLTDANNRVACRFEPDLPSARGILMGGGKNTSSPANLTLLHTFEPLHLTWLDKDITVPERAKIVTSGLGGVYPPGLPVGIVVHNAMDTTRLFQHAQVAPFVDFATLRHVAVLSDPDATVKFGGRE